MIFQAETKKKIEKNIMDSAPQDPCGNNTKKNVEKMIEKNVIDSSLHKILVSCLSTFTHFDLGNGGCV